MEKKKKELLNLKDKKGLHYVVKEVQLNTRRDDYIDLI